MFVAFRFIHTKRKSVPVRPSPHQSTPAQKARLSTLCQINSLAFAHTEWSVLSTLLGVWVQQTTCCCAWPITTRIPWLLNSSRVAVENLRSSTMPRSATTRKRGTSNLMTFCRRAPSAKFRRKPRRKEPSVLSHDFVPPLEIAIQYFCVRGSIVFDSLTPVYLPSTYRPK